jgi:hypothetical protein
MKASYRWKYDLENAADSEVRNKDKVGYHMGPQSSVNGYMLVKCQNSWKKMNAPNCVRIVMVVQ